jgi:hypothetical protein
MYIYHFSNNITVPNNIINTANNFLNKLLFIVTVKYEKNVPNTKNNDIINAYDQCTQSP